MQLAAMFPEASSELGSRASVLLRRLPERTFRRTWRKARTKISRKEGKEHTGELEEDFNFLLDCRLPEGKDFD